MSLNKKHITLDLLKRGQKGVIENITDECFPIKLLELGCLPGNEIQVIQIAPFKDPMYINVNGTHLAIRKQMAEKIVLTDIQ